MTLSPDPSRGLKVVSIHGYSTLPPVRRRATLGGRIVWGLLGFVAGSFLLSAPLMMLFGKTLVTDLLVPLATALLGATVMAGRTGRPYRLPVREVNVLVGGQPVNLLLPPQEHERLSAAYRAYNEDGENALLRVHVGAGLREFRASTIGAVSIGGLNATIRQAQHDAAEARKKAGVIPAPEYYS